MTNLAHFLLEKRLKCADTTFNITATLSALGYRATLAVFLCLQGK